MAKQPERRRTIDPTVADIIGRHEQRQADAGLTPKERAKKERERKKIKDRLGKRVTYDLPPGLKQQIADLAAQHGVSASQLAAVLLTLGLETLPGIDLEALKVPTKTPRYDHNLDLEKLKK